jgi:hypothetical protein
MGGKEIFNPFEIYNNIPMSSIWILYGFLRLSASSPFFAGSGFKNFNRVLDQGGGRPSTARIH